MDEGEDADEGYSPPSSFLCEIANGNIPLIGSEFATLNLQRLIEMTRDENIANRDWATMLLAQQDMDTPAIRDALIIAASDDDEVVQGEAILGLAQRDKQLALPLIQQALQSGRCNYPLFEAAEHVGDVRLVDHLRPLALEAGDDHLEARAQRALFACERRDPNVVRIDDP